ncbi:MAG: DNA cytosine methyltransferase [Pirellulales bacterium]|nr:DNA cytosine methyltransferase [Pirellulales bacterium]
MATSMSDISSRNPVTHSAKTFCEFFADIGLVREGVVDSGWSCVYANDNDPNKNLLYQARFGEEHFHLEDVRETERVLSQIPEGPFLATASFPCTDLSLAGNGRGFAGEHSSTYFAFTDVLARLGQHRPKLVLLENVPGFITSHQGQDSAKALRRLADLGYFVDCFMLDAKEFVPQSRLRVFVVGVHGSVIGRCRVLHWHGGPPAAVDRADSRLRPTRLLRLTQGIELATGWISTAVDGPPSSATQLIEVIDRGDEQEWWDDQQTHRHLETCSTTHRAVLDQLLQERTNVHIGTGFRRTRKGQVRVEPRFDGVAGCLRVPRGGSARQIVIVIEAGRLRMRWMSPREYARLQGAPGFPLAGTPYQQMAGFGDAVCVPVIRWIDEHVLSPLHNAISGGPIGMPAPLSA